MSNNWTVRDPGCLNLATLYSKAEAEQLRQTLLIASPGPWHVTVHGNHWHVEEIDPESDV